MNKNFDSGTFDSIEKYKMLDKINEFFETSNDNSMKRRIARIIYSLHKSIINLKKIEDDSFFEYTIDLIKYDFYNRINDQLIEYSFRRTIDVGIVTRLNNYTNAKLKNLRKERYEK